MIVVAVSLATRAERARVVPARLFRPVLPLGLLLVGAALKLPELVLPMGTDAGLFARAGSQLLGGGRPYVDFWDVPAPLTFYYWAFVQAIAGTDWTRSCLPGWGSAPPVACPIFLAHTLDLGLSVLAALFAFAIARRAGGSTGISTLAAFLLVFYANVALISVGGSNPDKLTLVPLTAAVWAYLRACEQGSTRWAVLAGVCSAVAVLAKQPALVLLFALLAHSTWDPGPRGWRRLRPNSLTAGIALGFGGVAAVVLAYFAAIGSLGPFVDQSWIYPIWRELPGHSSMLGGTPAPATGIHHIFREAAALLFVGAGLGALALALAPSHPAQRFLLFWAAADFLPVFGLRQITPGVPSLALLAAFGIARLWQAAGRDGLGFGRPWAGRLALALVLGTVFILANGRQASITARAWYERGPQGYPAPEEALASYIRSQAPPGPIFVWSIMASELYPLTARLSASRFLNTEPLGTFSPRYQDTRAVLMEDLGATRPAVIVRAPHADESPIRLEDFPALRQLLENCYREEFPSENLEGRLAVYFRDAARPGCA